MQNFMDLVQDNFTKTLHDNFKPILGPLTDIVAHMCEFQGKLIGTPGEKMISMGNTFESSLSNY